MYKQRKVLSLVLALLMMVNTLSPLAYAESVDVVVSEEVQDEGQVDVPDMPPTEEEPEATQEESPLEGDTEVEVPPAEDPQEDEVELPTEPEESDEVDQETSEEPEETDEEELEEVDEKDLGDNPDNLSAPDDSPYAGVINYNSYPETSFGNYQLALRSTRADSPLEPGGVRLFKTATPVAGMVNTWDVELRVEGKDSPKTSDVILVIDTSGSMNDNQRMAKAKEAANAFIDTLLPSTSTRIGIVSFAYQPKDVHALSNNASSLKNAVAGLSADGGTFTQAGVKQAEAMLANSDADYKHIVLLSDGVPTYSYQIPNNQTRRDGYVAVGRTYETGTGYAESAYGDTRVGNGRSITSYIEIYNWTRSYYNHGNFAIAQARFAGAKGYNLYTLGLQTDPVSNGVLNAMVQRDGYFTEVTDPNQLAPVFQAIAGKIGSAVKNAKVTDPMGTGFQIPASNVGLIDASQGDVAYDSVNKSISWEPGTLTTPISEGSDIKFATLKYQIVIDDDILNVIADEDGLYPTNGDASITYVNADGEEVTTSFRVPKVDPVFYKVVKELQDQNGNVITDDRDFEVEVTGPGGTDGSEVTKTYELNSSTENSTSLITDLRYSSEYDFKEIGDLSDYDVEYYVNDQLSTDMKFFIGKSSTEDVTVKVVNKEKFGKITVTKVLDQSIADVMPLAAKSIMRAAAKFDFIVTGPNDYSESFSLPDENNSWTKVLDGLVSGNYSVEETTTGYTTSYVVNGGEVTSGTSASVDVKVGSLDNSVTFTNKVNENMTITAEKTWTNAPGALPEIWFQLVRINDDEDKTETLIGDPRPVTNDSVTWDQTDGDINPDLFVRYDENGKEYEYKVLEVDELGNDFTPPGFRKEQNGLQVENIFESPATSGFTSLHFKKIWDVLEGTTPPNITVQLIRNGEVVEGGERVLEYPNTTIEWESLPLYDDQGNEYVYSVKELSIPDYIVGDIEETQSHIHEVTCEPSQSQTDWNIQNPSFIITRLTGGNNKPFVVWTLNHVPVEKRIEFLREVISASKPGNFDQPLKDLEQYLNAGGDYFLWYEGPSVHVDVDPSPDKGEIKIDINVEDNVYKSADISYQSKSTWTHFAIGRYTTKLVSITNTFKPEMIAVSGTKTWDDADNQDGKRPESIMIRLLADGTEVRNETVSEPEWSWSFTGLRKYENGKLIVYTITEDEVSEYTTVINGYNVINSYTPGKTSVQVTKSWKDDNDRDGVRPEDVTIKLLADEVDTGQTLILNSGNDWTGIFEDLDEYKAGQKIVYTVEEVEVGNKYNTVITGSATEGYVVTNSRTPETLEVSGSKTWDDADNQDGKRPESITIRLLKDGTELDSRTVTAEDEWSWSFTDLYKYEEGEEIRYTISEDTIEGYTPKIEGYNVTNTHLPSKVDVKVTKKWIHGENDINRPENVTIKLLADGVATGKTLILNSGNNWTGSFTELDEYKAGKKIVYTVEEDEVTGYKTDISGNAENGFVVENTYLIPHGDFKATKVYEGDETVIRPELIFTLYRKHIEDGNEINVKVDDQVPIMISKDNPVAEWKNLPLTDIKGNVYTYYVVESFKEGGLPENDNWEFGDYDFDEDQIVNKVKKPVGEITVGKELIGQLFDPGLMGKDGEALVFKFKVTGPYGYVKEFDLSAGKSITLKDLYYGEYIIEETDAQGYVPEYKPAAKVVLTMNKAKVEVLVNNKHMDDKDEDPNLVEVKATKTWKGGPEADHKAVKLILKRHLGDKVQVVNAEPVVEGKAPSFTYTWKYLDKHSPEGYEYTYTVEEDGVKDGVVTFGENKYKVEQKGNDITNTYVEPPKPPEKEELPSTGHKNSGWVLGSGLLLLAAAFFLRRTKKA